MEGHSFENERGTEKNFGLVFAAVFTIVGLYLFWARGTITLWPFATAVLFALAAFAFPRILHWPNYVWFKFGLLLGRIIAPIVMAIVYLIVMVPLGLLIRLFGKDLLRLKLDPQSNSYWIERKDPPQPMKNQF